MQEIVVLRLGHRKDRDKRITTHVGLVARAFGATKFILTGDKDDNVIQSIQGVINTWGGIIEVKYEENWKKLIRTLRDNNYLVIHLTMYGLHINQTIETLRKEFFEKNRNLLVIVGAEKVPRIVYSLAHYNIAIGNQPHSEVAALAVFLDRLFQGKELETDYPNAKLKIIPSNGEKKVIKLGDQ